MLSSSIEDNTIKGKTNWHTPVIIITTIIAVASFVLSLLNFYDAQLRSKVSVIAGKQIRLFVAFPEGVKRNPKPCIMMTMMFINQGGKPGTVFDTKLDIKWLCGNRIVLEKEFQTSRELDNFLTAEGDCPQYPISPVVVLGKSNEVRRYAFVPYETIRQEEIPKNFDLEISVYIQTMNEWIQKGKYRVDNVSDVWQDLKSDTTFNAQVLDIREIN